MRYEYFDYDPFLFKDDNQTIHVKSEGFISYYAVAEVETFDRRYYPSRGLSFSAAYSVYTDNFTQYNGQLPFSALSANFTGVIPITNRFKMLPSVYGRVLIGKNVPYPYLNYMGGQVFGRYMQQRCLLRGLAGWKYSRIRCWWPACIYGNAWVAGIICLLSEIMLCRTIIFSIFWEIGVFGEEASDIPTIPPWDLLILSFICLIGLKN